MLADLADELGGTDAATRHLLAVAEAVDTPIAVNMETGPDTSCTAVIAHARGRRSGSGLDRR